MTELIAQIASSSLEQSTGIDEINRAITTMDEMTQQNASLVEETSAASQSLEDEGKQLLHLMNFFSNDDNVKTFEAKKPDQVSPQNNVTGIRPQKVANSGFQASEEGDEWEEF